MSQYISGDWNIQCDVCSKKIKASESKKRWDGLIVCKDDFEFRHPQDFLKARTDKISVEVVRKETITTDSFLCDLRKLALADGGVLGTSGQADWALADVDSCETLANLVIEALPPGTNFGNEIL